ncbi:MAG: prepilin-type cleavage/methylation domain-containing protein [Proteobacteria bacterium]|nr:MAG: prepilin-type cleavage/methylation domain-containing protein [Pseudomonadota bacterium]
MTKQAGLTLIELLLAMTLGLVLMAGAISLFQANQQTFRSNQGLIQIQEGTRSSFELLSRDLRQAGYISCGKSANVANVLTPSARTGLMEWVELRGYDGDKAAPELPFGTGVGERVDGTSAIFIQGMELNTQRIATHNPNSAEFTLAANSSNFHVGDIVMACRPNLVSIFQVTSVDGLKLGYRPGTHHAGPGNCSRALGSPVNCDHPSPTTNIVYKTNGIIARFFSAIWYIGNNGRPTDGDKSLFRLRLETDGEAVREEMVVGVSNMQLLYHQKDTDRWDSANTIDTAHAWSDVDAVNTSLTLVSAATGISLDSSNQGRLERTLSHIIALRNRLE